MNHTARRVIDRYLASRVASRFAAAMKPEKLIELMMKLRKGADASISMKQLIEVLNHLGGWKVEPFVGLVQLHGYSGKPDAPEMATAEDAAGVQPLWEAAKKDEVSALPANPKPGQRYTMNVTKPTTEGFAHGLTGFFYLAWLGAKGIRFTSPEGKVLDLLPRKFDLIDHNGRAKATKPPDPMKMPLYDVRKWFREETGFLEQLSTKLGMPTYEQERRESKPRTRANTGTCPCCFGNFKLVPRTKRGKDKTMPGMVLHGYQRPGTGYIHGNCFGQDWPPFELSPEGTEAFLVALEKSLADLEGFHKRLLAGEVDTFYDISGRKVFKRSEMDPRDWARKLESEIKMTESQLHAMKMDIKNLKQMVADWKPMPLPTEGSILP